MTALKDFILFFGILSSGLFLGILGHEAFHFFFSSGVKEVCIIMPGAGSSNLFEVRGITNDLSSNETIAMGITLGTTMIWVGIARITKVLPPLRRKKKPVPANQQP